MDIVVVAGGEECKMCTTKYPVPPSYCTFMRECMRFHLSSSTGLSASQNAAKIRDLFLPDLHSWTPLTAIHVLDLYFIIGPGASWAWDIMGGVGVIVYCTWGVYELLLNVVVPF
jgi:hypothetical protein